MLSLKNLLLLVLLLVGIAANAGVDGADLLRRLDSSDDGESGAPGERECEIEIEASGDEFDEVEFECKSKVENNETEIEDKIKFKIKTKDDKLQLKVEYEQEIESDTEETESETQYTVTFDRVIEYKKNVAVTNGGNAYDWASDQILTQYDLDDVTMFSGVVDSADGVNSTFSVSTPDDVVTFTFTISRGGTDESISANSIKIDFLVQNYPWTDSESYLALIASVVSERKVEIEYEDDRDDKVEDVLISFADAIDGINGYMPIGEFTWVKDAVTTTDVNATNITTADLDEIEVVATSPPAEGDDRIAFSFIGPDAHNVTMIYWDPSAGVAYQDESAATAVTALGTALLVVVGVVAALL